MTEIEELRGVRIPLLLNTDKTLREAGVVSKVYSGTFDNLEDLFSSELLAKADLVRIFPTVGTGQYLNCPKISGVDALATGNRILINTAVTIDAVPGALQVGGNCTLVVQLLGFN